jgi:hypothetical protein
MSWLQLWLNSGVTMKKFALVSLFFISSAFAFESQYELSVQKFESDFSLEEMKTELLDEAQASCSFRDHQGNVSRISDFSIAHISEQDFSSDPRCEWRGSCYMPAQVKLSAQFNCKL